MHPHGARRYVMTVNFTLFIFWACFWVLLLMARHGLFKFLSKSESQQVTNRSRSVQPRNPKLEPFHVSHPLSSPPDPIPSPYRSTILVSAIQLPDRCVLSSRRDALCSRISSPSFRRTIATRLMWSACREKIYSTPASRFVTQHNTHFLPTDTYFSRPNRPSLSTAHSDQLPVPIMNFVLPTSARNPSVNRSLSHEEGDDSWVTCHPLSLPLQHLSAVLLYKAVTIHS